METVTRAAKTFRYAYLANSDLVSGVSIDGGHAFTMTRGYDAQRELLSSIETKWSTTSRTKFDYAYDERMQRKSQVQSGNVFADYYDGVATAITRLFAYNGRGELTADVAFLGSSPADQSKPLHEVNRTSQPKHGEDQRAKKVRNAMSSFSTMNHPESDQTSSTSD